MIRSELRLRVRRLVNEPTERFVDNPTLDDWLTDAFTDFCEKTEFCEDTQLFTSVIGVADFTLPTGTLRVTGVWWNNTRIGFVTIRELDESQPTWRTAANSTPTNWTVESRGALKVFPPPNVATANILRLTRIFVPTWVGDVAPPNVPQPEYQLALVDYVAARIKERDREYDGAAYYENRYLAKLGKVRAAERFHQKGTDRDRITRVKALTVDTVKAGTF